MAAATRCPARRIPARRAVAVTRPPGQIRPRPGRPRHPTGTGTGTGVAWPGAATGSPNGGPAPPGPPPDRPVRSHSTAAVYPYGSPNRSGPRFHLQCRPEGIQVLRHNTTLDALSPGPAITGPDFGPTRLAGEEHGCVLRFGGLDAGRVLGEEVSGFDSLVEGFVVGGEVCLTVGVQRAQLRGGEGFHGSEQR